MKQVAEKKRRGRRSVKFRELSVSEKEKLYRQHIRLVVSIAKRYINRSPDFTFEDLIQEGILGLFRAVEKFNVQKGYQFSTYAFWWIREFIKRALDRHGRTIHIPSRIIEASNKYRKVEKNLSRKLGREPLIDEMATAMGITINRAQQTRKFLENPSKTISLEMLLERNECKTLSEFIENPKATSPVESASINIFKENLERTIKKNLTSREEKIIKMRFGLEDGIEHTLREVGREMGLSKERILQIIKIALTKLRNS